MNKITPDHLARAGLDADIICRTADMQATGSTLIFAKDGGALRGQFGEETAPRVSTISGRRKSLNAHSGSGRHGTSRPRENQLRCRREETWARGRGRLSLREPHEPAGAHQPTGTSGSRYERDKRLS